MADFLYGCKIPQCVDLREFEWQEFIKKFSEYSNTHHLSICLVNFFQRCFGLCDSSRTIIFFASLVSFDMDAILLGKKWNYNLDNVSISHFLSVCV